MSIPPLAGLATYQEAARIGYSVAENVERLLRYAWIQKRAMEAGLYWLASTPEWEVKEALGLHIMLDSHHAADIRERVGEMRNPLPRMDVSPDAAIDRFFDALLGAQNTQEKLVGMYGVLRPALLAAYQKHLEQINPIIDYPTRRMLKHIVLDLQETCAWGEQAVLAVTQTVEEQAAAQAWSETLRVFLAAAGGIMGDEPRPEAPPEPRQAQPFTPDFFPRRDERFAMRWNFSNPQRPVSLDENVSLDERTVALMCRRIVEMDVPEYMTRIIAEAQGEPWDYYVLMTRQLFDEVRHAMMGAMYFENRGVDWKTKIAIHPGMSIRLLGVPVTEAHMVLYAIEQKLMPATTGKRLEYEISKNSKDALAAHIQDYDWADEVLHVHIGRECLLPRLKMKPNEAVEKGWEIRATTLDVLKDYEARGEQRNWWPDFIREVLGRETSVAEWKTTRL